MALSLEFLPSALNDIDTILGWLLELADAEVARRYVDRIEARCYELGNFPPRGSPHDELGRGLRSIPFERSATICYRVVDGAVQITRVIRAGRDVRPAFD